MVELLRAQAGYCRDLGSPFYEVLLGRVADDVVAGGPALTLLAPHSDDPGPSALGLRLMGSVHALVLASRAPGPARHYPSVGGDGDAEAAWRQVRILLADYPDAVRERLDSPPQTNEVGRSAGLWGGVLAVLASLPEPLPVRLWELGASGGLNLRADRFRYLAADGPGWGTPDAGVDLEGAWTTTPAGLPSSVRVVERVGVDVSPVDPTTPDGALTLQSYVWPDQSARLARLRAAIDVARDVPAEVRRGTALDLVRGLAPRPGTLTVLWHSVMWQYVSEDERAQVLALLDAAGEQATDEGPLAHVQFEPRRLAPGEQHEFAVVVRTWPGGGVERVVGQAPPHGVPVTWRPQE